MRPTCPFPFVSFFHFHCGKVYASNMVARHESAPKCTVGIIAIDPERLQSLYNEKVYLNYLQVLVLLAPQISIWTGLQPQGGPNETTFQSRISICNEWHQMEKLIVPSRVELIIAQAL